MRVFQRDGRTVRFQWSEPDREVWGQILEQVRAIPNRKFNAEGKYWEAPWDQHACRVIQEAGFVMGEIRTSVGRNLEDEAQKAEAKRLKEQKATAKKDSLRAAILAPWTPPWQGLEIDTSRLNPKLREYQLEAMRFLKHRGGRGLIGDDMGTGKSAMALSWIEMHPELRPAVIVSTTSTKYQWQVQQRLWMSKDASRIEVLNGRKPYPWKPLTGNVIYILNWDILAAWAPWLDALDPKIVVGDEAHAIGNMTSERTKAFRKLAAPAHRHVIPMSGTPITTRPLQFFPILNLLDAKEFANFNSYKYRYCNMFKGAFGFDATGSSNIEELHLKLRKLMIRRTKKDVMKELPDKVRTPVLLPIVKDAEYEALEEKILGLQGAPVLELKKQVAELSRSAFAMKRRAVLDWIEDFLGDSDEKLLVFAWHHAVVDTLTMHLGAQCVTIDGSVDTKMRPALVQRFQEDPKCRVLVANIQSGGTGVDGLQDVCFNVAFVELTTVPAHVMQAEDRLHRMGQKDSTGVWYLLAPGTIDEDMLAVVESRRAMLGTLLDGNLAAAQDDVSLILSSMKQRKGGK